MHPHSDHHSRNAPSFTPHLIPTYLARGVGVSKRIRIYELASAMGGAAALGAECAAFPLLEISSRSRLSSVCWSAYVKV